ncbi:MAG: hypothetical protein GY931_08725 [Maribacter sp.]|nr:hypothetical protein [Maribacter sp.]
MVRKLALIPADMAAQFTMQQHLPGGPALQQLSNLDQEMKAILEDNEAPAELKLKQYYNTLRRYDTVKETSGPPPIAVKIEEPPKSTDSEIGSRQLPVNENEILEALPKAQRRSANLLIKHVIENPHIKWTKARELVFKGKKIPHSNIFDLILDSSRPRKNALPPAGWQEFGEALMSQNIPQQAFGNPYRYQDMVKIDRGGNLDTSGEPQTPKRPRRKTLVGTRRKPLIAKRRLRLSSSSSSSDASGMKQKGRGFLKWEQL